MLRRLFAVLLFAPLLYADPMPLDLAFSRRDLPRPMRPTLSPDGRYFAYEIRTPLVKTPDSAGEVEPRFLPNGVPAIFSGMVLWVSDTRNGESHPVCEEGARCWRGSWAPDSRQLAYYSDAGGELGVWIYDVASHQTHRLGNARIKAKIWSGDEAQWSSDGKTLYVLIAPPQPSKSAAPRPPSTGIADGARVTVYRTHGDPGSIEGDAEGQVAAMNRHFMSENSASIAAIDVASGEAHIIVPFDASDRPTLYRLSPDGKWISYVTVVRTKSAEASTFYQDLVIVPVSGGAPVAVFRDLIVPEDISSTTTLRWTPDSRNVVFLKDHDLWIAPRDGAPRRLAETLGRLSQPLLLLTTDGKSAVVGLDRGKTFDSDGAAAIAVVPLDGSAPHVIEAGGKPIATNEDFVWQPVAGSIFLVREAPAGIEREIVRADIASGKITTVWSRRARFDVVAATDAGGVVRYESNTTPPDFYLFNRNFEIGRRLSIAEPRFESIKPGAAESFRTTVPMYDGSFKEVSTHVFLPAGAKAGDHLPTIVVFYTGLPFTMYSRDFGGGAPNSIPVSIFTTRGYAVLFCDVPIGPEGKAGNPMREMTDVVVAQVHRAAELGYSDIKRMAIMGHSYGGYSTAAIITQTQLFRAAIALDGSYDLGGGYGWMSPGGSNQFQWFETGQGRMGAPLWNDIQRYIANSPYYQADKIHTPLLLIHGEKDGACPVADAQKMFSALRRLDRVAELAIYAGEGHVPGRWSLANAVDAANRMIGFLQMHM
jgi:dipeptidyl aminopeptidase/acylaminoacyl peptidase